MKRVSIWLVLVLVSATIGFAAATQSSRPRVTLNRKLVKTLLKVAPSDHFSTDCKQADKWQELKCRYKKHDHEDDTIFSEKWKIYGQGLNELPVTVHYNTLSGDVTIICRQKKCAP